MKKIVFESLNEVISFKREGNPLSTLGIGQRKLIENWLEEMEIFKYEINDDLTINKYNDVWLNSKSLYNFPNYIQFNEIKNVFFTIENNIFTSLRGMSQIC